MLEYRSAWQKMTSSRDHRYNTADPSTDHQEGASLIKYKPALLKPKDQLIEKIKGIKYKSDWKEERKLQVLGSNL